MEKAFTEGFDKYACAGDSIQGKLNGYDLEARIVHDLDYHIDDDDCHNTDQAVTGCDDEQQARLMQAREAWFNDEWFYCGIVVSVSRNGHLLDAHAASVWGTECNYPESDNAYLLELANELAEEAMHTGEKARAETLKALA